MKLLQRLKMAFNPRSHDAALSHYIPAVQYADSGVENAIWQSDLQKRLEDWRGNTGRVYSHQLLSVEGALLFPLKAVTTAGLGGTSIAFGQYITAPVAGFAGRPAALDPTSTAAEYDAVQE
jgi:hypothetical protein